MNTTVIPFAVCGAVAVGIVVYQVARPWKRLGPRVDTYTVAARNRLEGPRAQVLALAAPPSTATGVVAGVFGPIAAALAARLSALVGHRDEAALALALEQAGIRNVSPRTYSYQQLLYTVLGVVLGAALGLVLRGVRMAVLGALVVGVLGMMAKRAELDSRLRKRQEVMRAEMLWVCEQLACYARANQNLIGTVALMCERGRGEVVGEMRRVLATITSGTAPEVAFARQADVTAEAMAAALYRSLSVAATSGGALAESLLAHSAQIRDARRTERKARATRRTQVIQASNGSLMILPFLLLIGAGVAHMLFGSLQ